MENLGKWYIEITENNGVNPILQSDWFDTEEEALDWANKIVFFDLSSDYQIWLMYSEWDYNDETYTDIECVREIKLDI